VLLKRNYFNFIFRKRTLNQEVSSLHLILEMRTSELRALRDKNNVLEDKMEKFEVIKVF